MDWIIGLLVFFLGRYLGFRSGFSNGVNVMLDHLAKDGWGVEENEDGSYRYERLYGEHWYESRGL